MDEKTRQLQEVVRAAKKLQADMGASDDQALSLAEEFVRARAMAVQLGDEAAVRQIDEALRDLLQREAMVADMQAGLAQQVDTAIRILTKD